MAKTITWTAPYATPVVTPSLQAGGTLTLGTTYYYRVVALKVESGWGWGIAQAESPASVEVSATPAGANQTIRLSWPQVAGAAYYDVYRTTTSGNYGIRTRISASVVDGGAGGTTYDDDGSEAFDSVNCAIFTVSTLPMGFDPTKGRGNLTISGGTSGDPITLTDIYNAIGDEDFCKLQDERIFGLLGYWFDSVIDETHFKDTYKRIYLIGQCKWDYDHEDSVFQLGEYDSDNDCGYNGCQIYSLNQYNSSLTLADNVFLYKCHIFNGNYSHREPYAVDPLVGTQLAYTVELKDCTIQGYGARISGSPALVGLTLSDGSLYPVTGYFTNCEDITVKRGYFYIYYNDISSFKGLSVYNAGSYDIRFRDNKYMKLTNPYFHGRTGNVPEIYWPYELYDPAHYLDVYFEFDLKVVDMNNNAIANVTVTVLDKDNTIVANTATEADGTITTQEIKRARYTHKTDSGVGIGPDYMTTDDRNPFTLLVQKQGYETYKSVFTMIGQKDWEITLMRNPFSGIRQMGSEWV